MSAIVPVDEENLPKEQQSANAQTMEQRVEIVEKHLFALADRLIHRGYHEKMSSRDQARIILASLKVLEYARKVPKSSGGDEGEELREDDLVAMPKPDLEKLFRFAAKQLGEKQARELLGLR